jgi:hypothetical protein
VLTLKTADDPRLIAKKNKAQFFEVFDSESEARSRIEEAGKG